MTAGERSAEVASEGPVVYDVTDGVATIRLNRPEAMNSLDIATKVLLRETVRSAAEDPLVRCVVVTGTGRAFCTGQDLKEHIEILESQSSEVLFDTVEEHYNPIVSAIVAMEKPVIAAVNGVAAGAGASRAFACDLRVVADTAGFNLAFANVALSCDTGSSYTLQRLVGKAKALELLYLPRTIKAEEALDLGLASRVVPADDLEAEVTDLAGAATDPGLRDHAEAFALGFDGPAGALASGIHDFGHADLGHFRVGAGPHHPRLAGVVTWSFSPSSPPASPSR